jgi:hypothetical protein
MKSKASNPALLALILLAVCALTAKAAPIAFDVEDYTDAGLSTAGTLVSALNVGAEAEVNGITFSAITTGYTNPIALSGGVELDAFDGGGDGSQAHGAPGALTNVFFFTNGADTGYLTFSGLTEGQAYELQLVMSDSRAFNIDIWGDQTTNTGASDIFVDHGNSASKLVTGTFTADATGTQSLYVQVLADYPGHFNALQLRAIPELPDPEPEPEPVITFDVEDYTDGGLSTAGTLIGALNVGDAATVNTVPFTAITSGYTNPIALSGGVALDAFDGVGNGSQSLGQFGTLTHTFFFTAGRGTGYLTFSGLTEGREYELQLVMSDTRNFNVDIWGDQTTNTGASDIVVAHGNSASKIVTLTFTGDGTGTQSLYVQVLADYPGHFNALQLRAISPEGPVQIISITKVGAETSIVFDSVPGALYIVEFSFDLTTWLELTDSLLATDVTTTFIDDDAFTQTQNRVFYRVIPEQ